MKRDQDLRETEKKVFRSVVDDGLWDLVLASWISVLAIAPLLSVRMGDFWSSALMVPVVGVVFAIAWILRRRVVRPRVGVIRLGRERRARLRTFTVLMLAANVVFFVGGLVAAVVAPPTGWSVPIGFSIVALAIFSAAGFTLDFPRLYGYGLLLASAALIGEWLFREGYASHHGFPVCFGTVAIVMAVTGLVRFLSLARRTPPDAADPSLGGQDA